MSEQRLSKLQKWILESCFRVTVLLDRTALKKLNSTNCSRQCRDCPKTSESVRIERDSNNFIAHRCVNSGFSCSYFEFYKEDVLLSYFMLAPNNDIAHFSRVQHFHDSPDYAKAHVTVHRSIGNLVEKGFIFNLNTFREDSLQIHLTSKGIEKAAELLKISDWESLIAR